MNEALQVTESPNSPGTRCAYCHDSVSLENEYCCPGCEVMLHQDCCAQLSECPTLGCSVAIPESISTQAGQQLGASVTETEAAEPESTVSNFQNFKVGAAVLSKLAYQNLPVFYLLTALLCMLIGMALGQCFYSFYDFPPFENAVILDDESWGVNFQRGEIVTVSKRYLEHLRNERLIGGSVFGFIAGIFLRFFYLAIAAFGRRVNDVDKIKEKIKKNNSKSA